MTIEAICILIFTGVVIAFSTMLGALLVAIRAKLSGRYLNRYFIVSSKGDGVYELHHQPVLGFYFAKERKFCRMLLDALQKFQTGYPDMTLIATSLTLLSASRKGETLPTGGIRLWGARLLADFLILTNLANFRRVSGEWCFVKLIRRVHKRQLKRYVLIGR